MRNIPRTLQVAVIALGTAAVLTAASFILDDNPVLLVTAWAVMAVFGFALGLYIWERLH